MDETMGERLKSARIAVGITSARKAAKRFSWTVSTYAAHENGQNNFDSETAAIYAKAYNVSASWLLTGEGYRPAKGLSLPSLTPQVAPHARAPTGISLTGILRSQEPDEIPDSQSVREIVEATVRKVFPFAADRLPTDDEVLALVRSVIADFEARIVLPPRRK
jgi:transcriptional regulator with XRE-family HTH domain